MLLALSAREAGAVVPKFTLHAGSGTETNKHHAC
jgi:hypothetical protein